MESSSGDDVATYDYRIQIVKPKLTRKARMTIPKEEYLVRFVDLKFSSHGLKRTVPVFCEANMEFSGSGAPNPLSKIGNVMMPLLAFFIPTGLHPAGKYFEVPQISLDGGWYFVGRAKREELDGHQIQIDLDGTLHSGGGVNEPYHSKSVIDMESGWPVTAEGTFDDPSGTVTFKFSN